MLEINKEYLYSIYDLIAEIDFALNIAYYRASIENYCIPEILEKGNIQLENLYHPLLDKPIKNSINIEGNILFTGSNASGKFTFIKAVALNCIMAQNLSFSFYR